MKLTNAKIRKVIKQLNEKQYYYWIVGRSQGDLLIIRAWPCRECGNSVFITAPCFRDPNDEYAHMSILYCTKCGEGWEDGATFHMDKSEFYSLPEYTI